MTVYVNNLLKNDENFKLCNLFIGKRLRDRSINQEDMQPGMLRPGLKVYQKNREGVHCNGTLSSHRNLQSSSRRDLLNLSLV